MIIKENPLETSLVGRKVKKTDWVERFFGDCDELSSWIMLVRCNFKDSELRDELETIVNKLSIIMGEVAGGKCRLEESDLEYLYELIKKYEVNGGVVTKFVLPGQNRLSAEIHIMRTVSRRCELTYAHLYEEGLENNLIFQYLNKLSTLFYDIALRYEEE